MNSILREVKMQKQEISTIMNTKATIIKMHTLIKIRVECDEEN